MSQTFETLRATGSDRPGFQLMGPAAVLGQVLRLWMRRWRDRRSLGNLALLDDYLLLDVGVTRAEILREAAKPFWRR